MPSKPARYRPTKSRPPEQRESAAKRGYDHNWRRLRESFLATHPLCCECEKRGLLVSAVDVDHVIAKRQGGTDDESNLRGLCHSCHSRKTATEDGGLGRTPTPKGAER